jgi:hypothetical protein
MLGGRREITIDGRPLIEIYRAADNRSVEQLIKKCGRDGYPITHGYAHVCLDKCQGDLDLAIECVKTDIDSRKPSPAIHKSKTN